MHEIDDQNGGSELQTFVELTLDELERRGIKRRTTPDHTSDQITTWEPNTAGSPFDLVVLCATKSFFVHSNVVFRLSPKFAQKARQIRENLFAIDLQNVSEEIVELILDYAYNNDEEVLASAPFPRLIRLLIVAQEFKIKSIVQCLRNTLMNKDRSNIVIHLWDMSTELGNAAATDTIIDFIVIHIRAFTKQQFFAKLHWRHMYSILTSANAGGKKTSTDNLVKATMQWLHVDEKARKGCVPEITKLINWNKLSPTCLKRFLSLDLTFRALFGNAATENSTCAGDPMTPFANAPKKAVRSQTAQCATVSYLKGNDQEYLSRLSRDTQVPAFAVSGYNKDGRIIFQTHVLGSNLWVNPIDMLMPFRFQYSTTFCNKQYFVIGGNDNSAKGTNTCFVYNFCEHQSISFSDMATERLGAGIAVHGDDIYVIGGLNRAFGNMKYLTSVEKVNARSSYPKWEKVSSLAQKRAFPGVVVTKNVIYVIGGYTRSCEKYSFPKKAWTPMPDLPDRFRFSPMHAVLYKKTIMGLRVDDTSQMVVIDILKNVMTVINVNGDRPEYVIGCAVAFNKIWAVDREGAFYIYLVPTRLWEMTKTRCPSKYMKRVLTACFLNYSDLQGLCDLSHTS